MYSNSSCKTMLGDLETLRRVFIVVLTSITIESNRHAHRAVCRGQARTRQTPENQENLILQKQQDNLKCTLVHLQSSMHKDACTHTHTHTHTHTYDTQTHRYRHRSTCTGKSTHAHTFGKIASVLNRHTQNNWNTTNAVDERTGAW